MPLAMMEQKHPCKKKTRLQELQYQLETLNAEALIPSAELAGLRGFCHRGDGVARLAQPWQARVGWWDVGCRRIHVGGRPRLARL